MGGSSEEVRARAVTLIAPTAWTSKLPFAGRLLLLTPSLGRVFGFKSAAYANSEPLPR